MRNVLVVGAGIVGAAIALNLLRGGARVTVIDAGEPGGVATRNAWAWINATAGNPHPYFRLRVRSMQEWREWERTVPGVRVAWCGGLTWDLPPGRLRAFAAEHSSWGYGVRLVERAEAAALEPALADPPALAAHAAGEGVVEPADVMHALLAEILRLGGTVLGQTAALAVEVSAGRVTGVRTDAGRMTADETVVAAGLGSVGLAEGVGVPLPLHSRPSLRVLSRPHARLLRGLIVTPDAEIRQTAEGRVFACAGFAEDDDEARATVALHAAVQATLRSGEPIVWEQAGVVDRPIPDDWVSLLGRKAGLAGLYVAATHSGITLAPAIGHFVADEILHGRRDALLEPFGLGRIPTVA